MQKFLGVILLVGLARTIVPLILLVHLARTEMVFRIDSTFTPSETIYVKAAQDYWNRYTTHPDCKMTINPVPLTMTNTIQPPYDRIFTIRGDLTRPNSNTYTITRSIIRDGEFIVRDIDININLLYVRRCPQTFLPFLLHELGHVLGMEHNNYPDSIMNISSGFPNCKNYPVIHHLAGRDIYLLYHLLGAQCQLRHSPMKNMKTTYG